MYLCPRLRSVTPLMRLATVSMTFQKPSRFFFKFVHIFFNTTLFRFSKTNWGHNVGFHAGTDHDYLDFMGNFLAISSCFLLIWRQWKRESSPKSRQVFLLNTLERFFNDQNTLFLHSSQFHNSDKVNTLYCILEHNNQIPACLKWMCYVISVNVIENVPSSILKNAKKRGYHIHLGAPQ